MYVYCRKDGIEGRVDVNGAERNFKTFRKQSAYITQQDHLLPNLTVEEYMISAAHLKLGNHVCYKEKKLTVRLFHFMLIYVISFGFHGRSTLLWRPWGWPTASQQGYLAYPVVNVNDLPLLWN